jgi:hypothetical protein
MTDDPLPPDDLLTDAHHGQINRLCAAFAAEWRAGRRPSLAVSLRGIAEPQRSVLLCELLAVELRRRRQRDERPTPDEYARRFPEHAEVIAEVFREECPDLFRDRRPFCSPTRRVVLFAVLIDFRRAVR